MSRFNGKQYPGAMRDYREAKHLEATRRNYYNAVSNAAGETGQKTTVVADIIDKTVAAFRQFIDAFTSARDSTQNDYALAADAGKKGKQ